MGNLDYKQFSKRHRPHIHPPDSILFVTYRLAGSIPRAVVRQYKAKKDWLVDQLKRINHEARESDSPDLKKWLEDVENLNRAWFVKFEDIMHKVSTGPMWMKDERIADVVAESLRKLDGEAYRLDAYSVMSNHVHAVFKPFLSEKDLRESFDPGGRLIFTSKHPPLQDHAIAKGKHFQRMQSTLVPHGTVLGARELRPCCSRGEVFPND